MNGDIYTIFFDLSIIFVITLKVHVTKSLNPSVLTW